jgi:membrane protein DedA with SNARE-associated domain
MPDFAGGDDGSEIMFGWIADTLHHLAQMPVPEALAIFVGLMALEAVGGPVPSELVLPAAGWWVRAAGLEPIVGLSLAFVACTLGAMIGSFAAYAMARWGGRPLVLRVGRWLLLRPRHLERARRWVSGRGGWAVVVSRLIAGVRAFVSYPLGLARMPVRAFLGWSLLGIAIFDVVFIGLGYAAGGG